MYSCKVYYSRKSQKINIHLASTFYNIFYNIFEYMSTEFWLFLGFFLQIIVTKKRILRNSLKILFYNYFALTAAVTAFFISVAIVMGPTPPGTGVMAPATVHADSKSTSPQSLPFSSRFIPTSITTAPSLM